MRPRKTPFPVHPRTVHSAKLIGLAEVAALFKVSTRTAQGWVERRRTSHFPAAVAATRAALLWVDSDVVTWWAAKPGRAGTMPVVVANRGQVYTWAPADP